jgi:hypothetical protein
MIKNQAHQAIMHSLAGVNGPRVFHEVNSSGITCSGAGAEPLGKTTNQKLR